MSTPTPEAPGRRLLARNRLSSAAQMIVDGAGSALTAGLAVVLIVAWTAIGLWAGFSEHWMAALFAVTGAVTFVMVFFIQHTTGRQLRAVLLKLDELVYTQPGADDHLIAAEHMPLHEQERLEEQIVDHPAQPNQ